MYGLLIVFGFLVLVGLLGLWARHRERTVDDYYDREYQDPPAHGWTLGNGPW